MKAFGEFQNYITVNAVIIVKYRNILIPCDILVEYL